ncbi:type II/IV secretion system protein [bacterium]|nr:type II/IV secretion system protein [bacterium]
MNKSLVEFLQSKGLLTQEQVNDIHVERTKTSSSEEQILREKNLIDEDTIVKAKSELFNIPYVDLKAVEIPESVLTEINIDIMKQFSAVPFRHSDGVVDIAMLDPFDVQAIQALEIKYAANEKFNIHITTQEGINFILDRRVGENLGTEVSAALEDYEAPVTDLDAVGDAYVGDEELSKIDLRNAPVARIVNAIFRFAMTSNASDIHIEPTETKLRIRFRIYGVLMEKLSLPKSMISAVISRVKILARLKIDEKRIPLDGRMQIKIADRKVDVRVSTIPGIYGEKIVMRLLETDISGIRLEDSGMRGTAFQTFLDSVKSTNGIVLVTGPTGSGKTRTLAATIMKLNTPKVNIVTLEDPVEIRIPGVNQVQVRADVGLTFAKGLRAILRQDPNVVMVGEIRDQETAQLAIQASLTGHLVLSTLHTNSAAAAVPRLLDMGVEPYLLSSTLRCVVAQRLPRRVCKHCIEAFPMSPELIKDVKETLGSIKSFDVVDYSKRLSIANSSRSEEDKMPLKAPEKGATGEDVVYLYRGKGCQRCGDSGYKGRVGIFEVLNITEKVGRMMMENVVSDEVQKTAVEAGMVTMIQDGYLKALEGITTIEEVLRVSKE